MESQPKTFPRSDLDFVTARVADGAKGSADALRSALGPANGSLSSDELRAAFAAAGVPLETQEALTITRRLGEGAKVPVEALLKALAL